MSELLGKYDRDPEAIAWARSYVEREVKKLDRWYEQAKSLGQVERADRWRRMAGYLRRQFLGGEGCGIAAFDERKPDILRSLDGEP